MGKNIDWTHKIDRLRMRKARVTGRNKMPDYVYQRIMKLRAEGYTFNSIAASYDVKASTLRRYMRAYERDNQVEEE